MKHRVVHCEFEKHNRSSEPTEQLTHFREFLPDSIRDRNTKERTEIETVLSSMATCSKKSQLVTYGEW